MGKRLVRTVIAYLDTQIVIWLCQKQLDRLTDHASARVEDSELLISPMVLLELQYLYEIQRIIQPPQVLLNQLAAQISLKLCERSFAAVIHTALFESWTRDPFDRVIVAQAKSNAFSPLVTADGKIRENYPQAIW